MTHNIDNERAHAKHDTPRRTIFGHIFGAIGAATIVRACAHFPQPSPDAELLALIAETNRVSREAQNCQLPTNLDPPEERVRLGERNWNLCRERVA